MRRLLMIASLLTFTACKTPGKTPVVADTTQPVQVVGCDIGYKTVLINPLAADSLRSGDQSSPLWNDSTFVGRIKSLCVFPATDEDIGDSEILTRENLSKIVIGPIPFPGAKVFKVKPGER